MSQNKTMWDKATDQTTSFKRQGGSKFQKATTNRNNGHVTKHSAARGTVRIEKPLKRENNWQNGLYTLAY